MTRTVCIITPGHLASAPRVVKEADALCAAGWKVHVIAGSHFDPVEPLDRELLQTVTWTHTRVDYRHGSGVLARKILRRLARHAVARWRVTRLAVAARAQHAEALRLAAVAGTVGADLYIGHCLGGLAAAAAAARRQGTQFGFDAEDFHEAETHEALADPADAQLPRILQSQLLPQAAHVTSAAPLIGAELERRYGIRTTPVLNTFPLSHAPAAPIKAELITPERPAKVYWFSQTIGPGRGLEMTIRLLARLRTPAVLQLRGFGSESYRRHLQEVAREAGLARPIEFLPPAPPQEMTRLAAAAHVGLCVEESTPLNHDLCLANKIFVYLLAGIPQMLTPTAAHRALAPELGEAAILLEPSRLADTAARVDAVLGDAIRLERARATAWRLGHERYNWEQEQQGLVRAVESGLRSPRAA